MPEDWDYVAQQQIPTALRDGQWFGEYRFRHFKTGEAIAVECNVFPITDPDTNETIAIATVTPRYPRNANKPKRAFTGKMKSACNWRCMGQIKELGIGISKLKY
ncbi:MAG: PAS domain-containing protein [Hydrococcus sp. CSU_1_8]|nr:PAS domain-containing protein [Hydrococcus sp. CSU_1_8]